ncbi:MAG TPA: SGNH/GDSL hydrolase family protein [Candidatus Binatia bacterium]|nr:SGNH/GDSL hydrolase family protein [Candidatus Binatia bacterium]
MRVERALLNFLAVLTSAIATFAVLEVGARVYLEHFAPEARFVNYASYRQLAKRYGGDGATSRQLLSPHRYLGYYPTPGYTKGKNRHNSLGYRGDEIVVPKPAGELRIVCVGGSTTYDSDIEDYRLAYPSRLEAELRGRGYDNVTVINAGGAGWTSWESLIGFELRVLDLDPDIVINFDAINDVHTRFVWPPELYRGDNSGYRAANQSGLFMPSIFEHSTLLRILMIRAGWVGSHADISRTIDRLAPSYYGDVWRDQKRTGSYPDGIFREVTADEMLARNDLRYFARNLESLVAVAKAHDVNVVLASFAYSPDFPEEPRVTAPEYRRAIAAHNDVLRAVAERSGAAFFDFAAVFPTDRRYFTDGRHNNEEGAALKAKLFADFLVTSGLLSGRRRDIVAP